MPSPALIVGSGPTGLTLALSLARRGVGFRLISEAEGPGEHSRAMVVQARTLEFYDQLGFAEDVIREGVKIERLHLRTPPKREMVSVGFSDLGEGLSPYPFALAYAQDDHERFLIERLKAAGVEVEWRTKLLRFTQADRIARATMIRKDKGQDRSEDAEFEYICGCDGAHSAVRESAGIGFPGGTYEQLFYVVDVEIAGEFQRDLFANLGDRILALMFPVRSSGMQRLIGLVPPELSARADLTFEDIRGQVEPLLGVTVTNVNWFATYRVHHRVAERFRVGRAFLSGDAAHIHSPAGGQGMNTGIGDAINLGWKLAHVIQGRAAASILDTYERERIPFARSLISSTDRAFTMMVRGGAVGAAIRRMIAPLAIRAVMRARAGRHAVFRFVSQTRIHYPGSPLSDGKAGSARGGDRLPWMQMGQGSNFDPLRSLDWQIHVYGELRESLQKACRELELAAHAFPWNETAKSAGFARDAAYLVRPDGHIALAIADQSEAALRDFVNRFQLRFAKSRAPLAGAGRLSPSVLR